MPNILKIIRIKAGLSQEELSHKAKVGRSTISNIETDKYTPRIDVAIRIAQALNLHVEDIFDLQLINRKDEAKMTRSEVLRRIINEMLDEILDEKILERIYKFVRYYWLK